MKKTNLLVDLSNTTHIIKHAKFKKGDRFDPDLLFHGVLMIIQKMVHRLPVNGLLISLDSSNVWRRDIYPPYKQNRTATRDVDYEETKEVMGEIAEFYREHTNVPTIGVPRGEADDVIAVATQTNKHNNIVMSSDKDFVQLIDKDTSLYNIVSKGYRTTEDRDFDLFLKLIRGDTGDGIPSAVPRMRETKIREVFDSPAEFTNLLESTNSRGDLIKDVVHLNNNLINLVMQPKYIRDSIEDALRNINQSNFDYVGIRQYLVNHGLGGVMNDFDFNIFKMESHYEHIED